MNKAMITYLMASSFAVGVLCGVMGLQYCALRDGKINLQGTEYVRQKPAKPSEQ